MTLRYLKELKLKYLTELDISTYATKTAVAQHLKSLWKNISDKVVEIIYQREKVFWKTYDQSFGENGGYFFSKSLTPQQNLKRNLQAKYQRMVFHTIDEGGNLKENHRYEPFKTSADTR
jgi:hypothetical protein